MYYRAFFRTFVSLLIVACGIAAAVLLALPARAAVSDWQQGMSIVSRSENDFASQSFQESLQNLQEVGASHAVLIIPFYQSSTGSTDIRAGFNTPTDEALASGITYARSLGLEVVLKPHLEVDDGSWRAFINPSDREAWFQNYGDFIVRWAEVGEANGAASMVIGTEFVSLAASNLHTTNTENWLELIGRVRSVFSGDLTYSANSNNNNTDPFDNEKRYIGFWSALDYVALSAYYDLNSDGSVEGMRGAWNFWNNSDIRAFQAEVGKPIIFGEIGYRSLNDSYRDPWNWSRSGSYDATDQANAYEALMSYWNEHPYIAGVYWWHWESNPNGGGEGNTDYTPQGKPAQEVLARWFAGGTPTVPTTTPEIEPEPQTPEATSTPPTDPTPAPTPEPEDPAPPEPEPENPPAVDRPRIERPERSER